MDFSPCLCRVRAQGSEAKEESIIRPGAWIEAISSYRGTHLQAPNFAYALAARKPPPKLEELDLSSVRHMINGAEPVEMAVIQRFYDVFSGAAKLPPGVVFPTYGLAEHTVLVRSRAPAYVLAPLVNSSVTRSWDRRTTTKEKPHISLTARNFSRPPKMIMFER